MVSQMHTIYILAQKTIAWLGEATEKSNEAIRFFNNDQRTEHHTVQCWIRTYSTVVQSIKSPSPKMKSKYGKLWQTFSVVRGGPEHGLYKRLTVLIVRKSSVGQPHLIVSNYQL